jgi:hypothetical protein
MNKNKKQLWGFHRQKLKQWFLFWMIVGVGFFVLIFLVTATWIGVDVRERCLVSQAQYEGDCVEALIQSLDDQSNPFDERNRAIWALGQIGDPRSKEILEKYYTGNIPQREPYNEVLSQYEMKKALKLVNGGWNATHLIWGRNTLEL